MNYDFRVQILNPPLFTPSGKVKLRSQAWKDNDWIGTFNLWIVKRLPTPSVIYQQRSPKSDWAPGKLDVAAAGHYEDLETIIDGLREVREELGKNYDFNDLISLGRKVNVGIGTDNTRRNTVSDIFLVEDNSPLESYILQEDEVYALYACPVEELYKVHTLKNYFFTVKGKRFDGKDVSVTVRKDIFPPNWDDYHFKMTLLIKRFLGGESNPVY